MLIGFRKLVNAVQGDQKLDPVLQETLNTGYRGIIGNSTNRVEIDDNFHLLNEFTQALGSIPKGRTIKLENCNGEEIRIIHDKDGFRKAD